MQQGGKNKVIEYIKSDLYRYEGKTTWKSFVKYYRKNAGFRFLVAYRLVNAKGLLKIIGGILWTFRDKQTIQILRETKIGYGLYISHLHRRTAGAGKDVSEGSENQ